MTKREIYLERLKTQVVYLKNEFEQAVIRSMPSGVRFVKIKGMKEFQAHPDSALVADAVIDGEEISKSQYEAFT